MKSRHLHLTVAALCCILGSDVGHYGGSSAFAQMPLRDGKANAQLINAIYARDIPAVETALDAGADIEARIFGGGSPALLAAKIDAWDICLLIERGARTTVASQSFMTIAAMAASSRVADDSKEGRALAKVRQTLGVRAR